MSGFSITWLDLREDADQRARDFALADKAISALGDMDAPQAPNLAVDLGAGTGSTLRALQKLGANDVVWRLVDHDGTLLNEALRRHRKEFVIEDHQCDLQIVAELPLAGARLVTASALFDLCSESFINALCARISAQNTGIYAALNYDGTTTWHPSHPFDEQVLAAFNQDQQRDKGLGPALGPQATSILKAALEKAGYSVEIASSPWKLDSNDEALVKELIAGIHTAVAKSLDHEMLAQWVQFRLDNLSTGTCVVGHADLLALPKLA